MNRQKKKHWLLPLLLALLPLSAFSQEEKGKFLDKWAIGAGYNFLNDPDDPEDPFDKRMFELSVKYRLTDKHSFYLMIPLYVENSKKKRKKWNSSNAIPCLHRIWGTELGYNYTVFDWKNLRAFGGIGLSYLHSRRDSKYLTEWVGEWGNKRPTDYYIFNRKYNAFGLSPQVGIAYQFRHIECELKYKYSLCRMESDVRWIESDGSVNEGYIFRFRQYFESLHGLSIGLFYHF